ncbi:hypothetical protein [Flammeovirga sp. SJP92]|uniref:hypothetical protein n=1 Tax=Flammeovirga sp. SJP92 TaxID=1775430 RepID=UPI000788F98F|nr:hypothetical protein [Flammeovirga sp. SJP92]KXX67509.1 hypothetical protein AVL50_25930 [Flammeovirga sp. SJP92]
MKRIFQFRINTILVFIISLICIACNEEKKETINNDISTLSKIINLTVVPNSAIWEVNSKSNADGFTPGPTDYQLYCVLDYDSTQIQKLMQSLENHDDLSEAKFLNKKFIKKWYPISVQEQFYSDGNYLKLKSNVYQGQPFYKGAYLNGFFFVTYDYKVFVYLYSM